MRGLAPKLPAVACALLACLVFAAPALAVPHVEGSFETSATGASNLKMVLAPDNDVWMTLEGSAKDVARISPSGTVTEFEFEGTIEKPLGLAVGPEGALWGTTDKGVVKFTTGAPTKPVETPIAGIAANDSIVAGPDGQMWVAATNAVIHFAPTNPAGATPIPISELTPHDIDVAGSLLVIADANKGRIVTLTTAGVEKDVPFVDNPNETSQGVAGSPGGQFAFSESGGKEGLALATPPNPATTEKRPGDPFGVALGIDGAYYFAMSADEDVRRLPANGAASTAITGVPKEFHPRQVAAGANNTIWVASENNATMKVDVTRISGLEPPPPPVIPPGPVPIAQPAPKLPQTRLGKKPKKVVRATGATAKVTFGFSSSTAGASFECSLGRRVKPKGKKARFVGQAFGKCKSPQSYRLKPGRYRFQVRAVAGGLRDSSPAKFSFKVIKSPKR
jgi:hypothetical protein